MTKKSKEKQTQAKRSNDEKEYKSTVNLHLRKPINTVGTKIVDAVSKNDKKDEKELVALKSQREENARLMAEAWGLLDNGSDGDEEEEEDFSLNKGQGVGIRNPKVDLSRPSIESRVEKARIKRQKQEKSIELTEWIDEDEKDDSMYFKGKRSNKQRRIKKLADQLSSGKESIHPLALQAESRKQE